MWGRRVVGLLVPLLLVGALMPEGTHAQEGEGEVDPFRASWRIRAGLARQGVSDGLASPLPHVGTGPFLGVGFGSPGHSGGWGLDAAYWGPRVSSRIATDDGGFEDTHQANLGIVWLRPVGELAGGRVRFHAGAALDVRFAYRAHMYDAWQWGPMRERFGDIFVPLQAAGMWSAPMGERGLLTHRLAVPALTLAFRSPYTSLKYFPGATLESPFSVTGLDSQLEYRTRSDGGWLVGFFHHMTLVRYPDPRPLSWVVHRVGVEVGR